MIFDIFRLKIVCFVVCEAQKIEVTLPFLPFELGKELRKRNTENEDGKILGNIISRGRGISAIVCCSLVTAALILPLLAINVFLISYSAGKKFRR